jgi:transcriptional regulator with GAF, ATPase, and Fis domain
VLEVISLACTAALRTACTVANEAGYPAEEAAPQADLAGIVGASRALQAALHDVARVSATDATVLVTGESGTGKELIAGAIHQRSRRAQQPIVKLNCAALPANLIESELFGHERGAFTGAGTRREGRFALADGGTIFLDEIGELPVELQAKLLRVLQEGEFEPVGSSRTRRVDVRVVAATHRDLAAEVHRGRFREDLYYRLSVFPVHLPPLRERVEDIPLLIASFLRSLERQLGRSFDPPAPSCLRRLQEYRWPGNVRELHNVVERAAILARERQLDFARALPSRFDAQAAVLSPAAERRILTVRELEDIERTNIVLALEAAGWRVSGAAGAAQLLGMNPSTLASRIKALGLQREARKPSARPPSARAVAEYLVVPQDRAAPAVA